MPIYEYRCSQCGKRESKFWRSLAAVDEQSLACASCGSKRMTRLVSKVRVLRGGSSDAGTGAMAGDNGDIDQAMMREMEGLDENDPRALGRFMRKMAAETGESLGPEFDEVVGRLEKGEDPDKIERDMGDILGSPDGGMEMPGGMSDDMGMSGDMLSGDMLSGDAMAEPSTADAPKPERKPAARRRPHTAKSLTSTTAASSKGKRKKNTA